MTVVSSPAIAKPERESRRRAAAAERHDDAAGMRQLAGVDLVGQLERGVHVTERA